MIQEIKNSCKRISPSNSNDNKDYLCDSVQIEQSSTCIDIEATLKESDLEYDNEQESKQSNNKHHMKGGFKSTTLICFDPTTKIYNSISAETKTVEIHQDHFAASNSMTKKCLWQRINSLARKCHPYCRRINRKWNWRKEALKEKFKCEC